MAFSEVDVKNNELEKICAYCEHATLLADSGVCVCDRNGTVRTTETCRRFRADLLKVRPLPPLLPDDSILIDG